MSFVAEVYGGDRYVQTGDYRFATRAEALAYAKAQTNAAYRASESPEPVNYRYSGGKLAQAEPCFVPPVSYGPGYYFP